MNRKITIALALTVLSLGSFAAGRLYVSLDGDRPAIALDPVLNSARSSSRPFNDTGSTREFAHDVSVERRAATSSVPGSSIDNPMSGAAPVQKTRRNYGPNLDIDRNYKSLIDKFKDTMDHERFARFYGVISDASILRNAANDQFTNAYNDLLMDRSAFKDIEAAQREKLYQDLSSVLLPAELEEFKEFHRTLPARKSAREWLNDKSIQPPSPATLDRIVGIMTDTEQRFQRQIPSSSLTQPERAVQAAAAWKQINASVASQLTALMTPEQLASFAKHQDLNARILQLRIELASPSSYGRIQPAPAP